MPAPALALGDETPFRDTHRVTIRVGDRVAVIAYGFGATLDDVRETGVVAGVARTRLVVDLGHATRRFGADVLAVLDRTDETSNTQEGNRLRRLADERAEREYDETLAAESVPDRPRPVETLDGTAPCLDCSRGAGDLVHASGQHPYRPDAQARLDALLAWLDRNSAVTQVPASLVRNLASTGSPRA